jgi:hypothetical protein
MQNVKESLNYIPDTDSWLPRSEYCLSMLKSICISQNTIRSSKCFKCNCLITLKYISWWKNIRFLFNLLFFILLVFLSVVSQKFYIKCKRIYCICVCLWYIRSHVFSNDLYRCSYLIQANKTSWSQCAVYATTYRQNAFNQTCELQHEQANRTQSPSGPGDEIKFFLTQFLRLAVEAITLHQI